MPDTAFVLIVQADRSGGEAIAQALSRADYACNVIEAGSEAIDSLKHRPPDVVVTDFRLGDKVSGVDVLKAAKRASPETEVILIVEKANEAALQEALRREEGPQPYDCLVRPFDMPRLHDKVSRAAKRAITARETRFLREQLDKSFEFCGIIGNSDLMRREIKRLKKIAPSKSTVLIVGETGTGKELFAQAIHLNSPRAGKPFKVMNCAAVSATLLESELFGHVRGAYTGAVADRKGLVQAADGGTLFLDEIGDMPLEMQAKLLRTLDTGEVLPVGSNDVQYSDVRFVAATNHDLSELMRKGQFREDLFYRLHAHGGLRIHPLRQRREDIPVLVQRFIEQANQEHETEIQGAAGEVMRKLVNYNWPGNVRELRNVIFRMCLEAEGPLLQVDDLP